MAASPIPRFLYWLYQAAVAFFALVAVWLITLPDETWVERASLGIWLIFVADYLIRLVLARERRRFI